MEIKNILLTQKEVLNYLNIKRSSLYCWINNGSFPAPIKLGERVARWHIEDIKDWLNKKHIDSKKDINNVR